MAGSEHAAASVGKMDLDPFSLVSPWNEEKTGKILQKQKILSLMSFLFSS